MSGSESAKKLFKILHYAAQNNVSDIHFRVGAPPAFRVQGELVNVAMPPYNEQDVMELARTIVQDTDRQQQLARVHEMDGSFELPGLCRFRFNVFRFDGKLGVVMRLIPAKIPTLDELQLPSVVKKIASTERGFVLVTGATGNGKSTTLAAMIDHINANQSLHIVTIEDPIEFMHPQKKCKITQREVGRDTQSFAGALRAALRQDPDVILVGEMRDAETIDIALKAAETGHTVFSTVHTTDASKTIGRMVSMFPADEQQMVRLRLADCLKATISQRLMMRADKKGRVCAQEIMIVNTAIAECIADPTRTAQIPEFIENGHELLGTQTFQQHLLDLYRKGTISLEVAKAAAPNAADFERYLRFSDAASNKRGTNGGNDAAHGLETSAVVLEMETASRPKKSAA